MMTHGWLKRLPWLQACLLKNAFLNGCRQGRQCNPELTEDLIAAVDPVTETTLLSRLLFNCCIGGGMVYYPESVRRF
jgi:hypothetical protein